MISGMMDAAGERVVVVMSLERDNDGDDGDEQHREEKNAFLTMRCASFATLAQERYVGMPAPQFILQSPRC